MNIKKALGQEIFSIVSDVSDELQLNTFVVGGFVRDYLLKRQNKKDIDFVCEGDGILLAKAVAKKLGAKKINLFKRYGTAMIHHNQTDLEFVGARKESYSKDSRNPFVESGSIEDDQKRRDFTINAMAISLQKESFGQLIDPFQGIKDLENKILRTPLHPNLTFSDDPLRMMRAIRFAAQLDFTLEKESFEAIRENHERIKIVSMERIMDEFNKIILTPKPSVGLALLDKTNLLQHILPELIALKGVEDNEGKAHKDNFWHTLQVVDNIAQNTDSLWLRWAALLHDIGKAPTKRFHKKNGWSFHGHEFVGAKMVKTIFYRLKLPLNETVQYVQKMVSLSSRPIALIDDLATDSALRRLLFDAANDLNDLFTLCKADITTKNEQKKQKFINNFLEVEDKIKKVEAKDQIANFQPPISGEEIMEYFGLFPCKEIGVIKNAIKEAILDGKIDNNKTQAFNYMIELGKKLHLTPKK
jgi:poly(A) polymerase